MNNISKKLCALEIWLQPVESSKCVGQDLSLCHRTGSCQVDGNAQDEEQQRSWQFSWGERSGGLAGDFFTGN